MVRLEYEGVEISIPENWDDITLGRYELLKFDTLGTARQRVELAAAICGVNAELFLNWPTEVFNRIVDYIGFMFENIQANPCPTVEIDGVNYAVSVEDKLTLAEWVDIEEVQKTGEAVMSTILAIVCRPVGEVYNPDNTENRQAMFAALPVGQILGVFAFFLTCKNAYDRRTAAFSNLVRLYDLLPPEYKAFAKSWGWYKVIADLAGNQILRFDEIVVRPVAEVFKFILYLKDKNAADAAQDKLDRYLNKTARHANH